MEDNIHGVVCGHIHTAAIRKIGELEYYNSGDWVESLTALAEDDSGSIHLLTHQPEREPAKTAHSVTLAEAAL
jgi:UDP-2,3-diacylglucosamine pyrophosphatase LpxH